MEKILYCEPGRIFCRSQKVMLTVDGSEGSARAATVAFEIAEITSSKVFIVHVVPTPYVRQYALMSDGDPADVLRHYRENGEKLR